MKDDPVDRGGYIEWMGEKWWAAHLLESAERERDKWRDMYDEACAVLREPDSTNDGGPVNLANSIRDLIHNYNVIIDDLMKELAEVKKIS